jgi:hypothetical protein
MLRRFLSQCICLIMDCRLSITARQYGEVVLPDASTGQGPGTPSTRGYKLSRSQKSVMVQEFNCRQMSVSGCKNHYKFFLGAGAKAKSVTNNLPILSVLWAVVNYWYMNSSPLITLIGNLVLPLYS